MLSALMTAGLGVACRRAGTGGTRTDVDAIAERYVRLTLQLAQHQPSLVETYLGADSLRPGPRVPVGDIRVGIDELERETAALSAAGGGDRDHQRRVRYLAGQAQALQTAARRLAGEGMRFADEARAAM